MYATRYTWRTIRSRASVITSKRVIPMKSGCAKVRSHNRDEIIGCNAYYARTHSHVRAARIYRKCSPFIHRNELFELFVPHATRLGLFWQQDVLTERFVCLSPNCACQQSAVHIALLWSNFRLSETLHTCCQVHVLCEVRMQLGYVIKWRRYTHTLIQLTRIVNNENSSLYFIILL